MHHHFWKMQLLKQATYVMLDCNSKTIKICPNLHADLLRFLLEEDSLEITGKLFEKRLELVSRSCFSYNFKKKNAHL